MPTKKQPVPRRPIEAYQILKNSLKFLGLFGIIIGLDARRDWKYNVRFAITKLLTAFTWTQLIYTQLMYVYQHNSVRTFEVFAVYGIGVSVK